MEEKRVIVRGAVVAEYIGDSIEIAFRVNNHLRTYLFTQIPGGWRLTVTLRGVTEEIPLPEKCEVVT